MQLRDRLEPRKGTGDISVAILLKIIRLSQENLALPLSAAGEETFLKAGRQAGRQADRLDKSLHTMVIWFTEKGEGQEGRDGRAETGEL